MRAKLQFVVLGLLVSLACAQDVRIGVLGLFHPSELKLTVVSGFAVVVHIGAKSIVLEETSGLASAQFKTERDQVIIKADGYTYRVGQVTVTNREGRAADFVLTVPGKIARRYHGALQVTPDAGVLIAIVSMDLETAVASVVGAESAADVPAEALKAQAVATRTYYVAGRGRHHTFDFCDTTHCQLLREIPQSSSRIAEAVSSTRGQVLVYQTQPFLAMYTRSCSGQTKTPRDRGMAGGGYPYYSVECKRCQQHPFRWQRRLAAKDAAQLRVSNEGSRLKLVRRLGWNTVPGDDFILRKERDEVVLMGVGMGHGIGLCQAGAEAMARDGASFREILVHYYPNTSLVKLGASAR